MVKKISGKTKLIGVSVLTSLDNHSLKEIGFNKEVKKLVFHQAKLAKKANLDAVVCSAQEVNIVRKIFKKDLIQQFNYFVNLRNSVNNNKNLHLHHKKFKIVTVNIISFYFFHISKI